MTQDTEASQDAVETTTDELDRAAEELNGESGVEETAEENQEAETAEENQEAETAEENQEAEVEEATGETEVEEPLNNGARTRMGRKMKSMMENMDVMQAKLDALTPAPVAAEDEDGAELLTVAEADARTRRTIATMNQENEAAAMQYEVAFVQRVGGMGEGDEHEAIVEEMLTNFNNKTTGDPTADAEINYAKATAAFYKGQMGKAPARQNPVKGAAPSGALGVSSKATMPKKSAVMPKLTELEQDFVNSQGMSPEAVKRALG